MSEGIFEGNVRKFGHSEDLSLLLSFFSVGKLCRSRSYRNKSILIARIPWSNSSTNSSHFPQFSILGSSSRQSGNVAQSDERKIPTFNYRVKSQFSITEVDRAITEVAHFQTSIALGFSSKIIVSLLIYARLQREITLAFSDLLKNGRNRFFLNLYRQSSASIDKLQKIL